MYAIAWPCLQAAPAQEEAPAPAPSGDGRLHQHRHPVGSFPAVGAASGQVPHQAVPSSPATVPGVIDAPPAAPALLPVSPSAMEVDGTFEHQPADEKLPQSVDHGPGTQCNGSGSPSAPAAGPPGQRIAPKALSEQQSSRTVQLAQDPDDFYSTKIKREFLTLKCPLLRPSPPGRSFPRRMHYNTKKAHKLSLLLRCRFQRAPRVPFHQSAGDHAPDVGRAVGREPVRPRRGPLRAPPAAGLLHDIAARRCETDSCLLAFFVLFPTASRTRG